jgi:hypothetical protein
MRIVLVLVSLVLASGAAYGQTTDYGDPDFTFDASYRYGFPDKLTLDETGDLSHDFSGDLEVPFTMDQEGRVWLAVYTEGANPAATTSGGPGGAVTRAAGIDGLVWVSAGVDMPAGSGAITWDGTDFDGNAVGSGTYRYYLFAVNQDAVPTVVGGGGSPWNQSTRFDPSADANAPMVYWIYNVTDVEGGANGHSLRRAPMGTDYSVFYPAEGVEKQIPYETFAMPWVNEMTGAETDGGWNDMGSLEIEPTDNNVFYISKSRNTPQVGVFRAILDEDAGTITPDPDWPVADAGSFVAFDERLPNTALAAGQHHPWVADDGLIWVAHRPNGWPVTPAVYSIERATGEIVDMIDYTEYYVTPWVDADGGDQSRVEGPWGIEVDDTGIYTSGGGNHQFWDNVAEGEWFQLQSFPVKLDHSGNLLWKNENGDGFVERLFGPEADAAGVDNTGMQNMYVSDVSSTSWGISIWSGYNDPVDGYVLGPDGSGLFKIDRRGVPRGTNPGFNRWVNNGSAWDGYYTQTGGQITATHTPADLISGLIISGATAILEVDSNVTPEASALGDAYPNPFNPDVTIPFEIANVGKNVNVRIAVYNVAGQEIVVLADEPMHSATYEATWDGLDANGNQVGSGVYVYQLTAGDFVVSKRMSLLK